MAPRKQKLPDTTGRRHIRAHGDCGSTDQCKFKPDKMSALEREVDTKSAF